MKYFLAYLGSSVETTIIKKACIIELKVDRLKRASPQFFGRADNGRFQASLVSKIDQTAN